MIKDLVYRLKVIKGNLFDFFHQIDPMYVPNDTNLSQRMRAISANHYLNHPIVQLEIMISDHIPPIKDLP